MNLNFNKLLRLFRIQRLIKPKTFYDNLAEDGLLIDYLRKYMNNRFEKDSEFRARMFGVIEKNSKEIVPELEKYYLENLCEKLSFFEEYTKEWNQKL